MRPCGTGCGRSSGPSAHRRRSGPRPTVSRRGSGRPGVDSVPVISPVAAAVSGPPVAACLEAGEVMAPIPLAEGLVAIRLLEGMDGPVAAGLLDEVDGGEVVSIAPAAPVAGTLPYVPAGAVARRVLYRVGDSVLVTADGAGTARPNLGPLPVAHRRTAGSDLLVGAGAAASAWLRADQEWRICVTALVLGAARPQPRTRLSSTPVAATSSADPSVVFRPSPTGWPMRRRC